MAITPEVRMEAEAGKRTLEVVWVGAGGAAGARVKAGVLTFVEIVWFIFIDRKMIICPNIIVQLQKC